MDITPDAMSMLGALVALVVFGIFIGTWWWYGMRPTDARALVVSGRALLLDVDEPKQFAAHPVSGARHIPLAELEERAHELGSRRRAVVLCGHGSSRIWSAKRMLRAMGYRVIAPAGA